MQYKFNQLQFLCKNTSFSKKSKREGLEICRHQRAVSEINFRQKHKISNE